MNTFRTKLVIGFLAIFFITGVTAKRIINVSTTPVGKAMKFAGGAARLAEEIRGLDKSMKDQPNFKNKDNFNKWKEVYTERYEALKGKVAEFINQPITKEEKEALDKQFPNFKENYLALQKRCKMARSDIKRVDMPVINPDQIPLFKESLERGDLDIKYPHFSHVMVKFPEAQQKIVMELFGKGGKYKLFPKNLTNDLGGRVWLFLGRMDGKIDDDKIEAIEKDIIISKLQPTQGQIWLSKLVYDLIVFGGASPERKRIIVSKEDKAKRIWIVDGHHHYGKVMLESIKNKQPILQFDLGIIKLLKVGVSFGNALGNKQQQ